MNVIRIVVTVAVLTAPALYAQESKTYVRVITDTM